MKNYNVGDVVCMGDGNKKRFILNIFTHKVLIFIFYFIFPFFIFVFNNKLIFSNKIKQYKIKYLV